MATGIVIVDKPAGWTSFDVVAKLRRAYGERRIGHGGTLDPMATGVLPVFVGRGTRAVPFFEAAEKTYVAGLHLGVTTDTEDSTGTVLTTAPVAVTEAQVRQAVASLVGERQQLPPMYSAVKVGGKKLYELARAGKTAERKPRAITVYEAELLSFDGRRGEFRARCSKGTYVRSLCRELGEQLGCGGCMDSLRRVAAGAYTEADAVPLEAILADPAAHLRPLDTLFAQDPAYTADAAQTAKIRNGAAVGTQLPPGQYRVYDPQGQFLILGESDGAVLRTVKSFFEVTGE